MLVSAASNLTSQFTGKERDAETGLDYFLARYYSGAQGRFLSPDEWKGGIVDPFTGQDIETNTALPYADITDPQTLNKYAYVRNNPLRYIDPTGHCIEDLCIGEAILVYAAYTATAATSAYLLNKAVSETRAWLSSKEGGKHSGEPQANPHTEEKKTEGMLGEKGTQVTSETVGKLGNGVRVDVENPNPGQRPGQIQVQKGSGKGGDTLIYDPKTGNLTRPEGANPSEANKISKTDIRKITKSQDFQKAIEKAKKILGDE
jgi:RHS repeat-associated protein